MSVVMEGKARARTTRSVQVELEAEGGESNQPRERQ